MGNERGGRQYLQAKLVYMKDYPVRPRPQGLSQLGVRIAHWTNRRRPVVGAAGGSLYRISRDQLLAFGFWSLYLWNLLGVWSAA